MIKIKVKTKVIPYVGKKYLYGLRSSNIQSGIVLITAYNYKNKTLEYVTLDHKYSKVHWGYYIYREKLEEYIKTGWWEETE